MPEYDIILYKKYIYLHSTQKKNHMHEKTGEGHNKGSKRITGGAVCGRLICPLSSRQVKYLKLDVDDACISF